MSKEKGNYTFFSRLNALLIACVLLVVLVFLYYPKYKRMHQLDTTEKNLDSDISDKEEMIMDLKEKQRALIHDKESLEKVARDKLGYSSSEELIYQFEDSKKP